MTHTMPLGQDRRPDATQRGIGAAQDLIGSLANPDKFFRLSAVAVISTGRLLSRAARDYLTREEFTCVLWNVVPRDWEDPEAWVERALQACLAEPEPLIVLHDHLPAAMSKLDSFIGLNHLRSRWVDTE